MLPAKLFNKQKFVAIHNMQTAGGFQREKRHKYWVVIQVFLLWLQGDQYH